MRPLSVSRLTIVLLLMAFFRSPSLGMVKSLLVLLANAVLVVGQKVKLENLENGRLYLLKGRRQDEGGAECSICLQNCEKGDRVIVLPCFAKHLFHAACLRNWLKERRECPLCRQSLQHYGILD
jgi:hypothetical protein